VAGRKAEALGVNVFTGFPAAALLVEGNRVLGVRTTPSGLDRSGQPGSSFTPPTDIVAKVTALSEGTRGLLSQAYFEWQNIGSPNPQIFALGVKEIWETKKPLDAIIHTLGWPLPKDTFGGSFMYPLEPNVVAIGIVAGLDYHNSRLDVHALLQQMKQHPLFQQYLENGELMEWGAKTIPEGGYYSLPQRRHGDGLLILGDAAGFVEVASLKGIHYAIKSGILAARAIFDALKRKDTTAAALAPYDEMVNKSYIVDDLKRRRNMRLAFKDGFYVGGIKAGLMTITGGAAFGGKIDMPRDADVVKEAGDETTYHPTKTLGQQAGCGLQSSNATRDDIHPPNHRSGRAAGDRGMYEHMCPAGVYERRVEAHGQCAKLH
jgi:electron-transferring-flavoprotein dehydrogenase